MTFELNTQSLIVIYCILHILTAFVVHAGSVRACKKYNADTDNTKKVRAADLWVMFFVRLIFSFPQKIAAVLRLVGAAVLWLPLSVLNRLVVGEWISSSFVKPVREEFTWDNPEAIEGMAGPMIVILCLGGSALAAISGLFSKIDGSTTLSVVAGITAVYIIIHAVLIQFNCDRE